MRNKQKACTIVVLAMVIVFSLYGCGTVKNATEDNSNEQVTQAPKTNINASNVRVSPMYVSGIEATVLPSTVVAVYGGMPFSAATLIGTDIATADELGNGGAFTIDISGCAAETLLYVVATAQGYSTSDPVALQKP